MDSTDTAAPVFITDDELATLNAARTALTAIEHRARFDHDSQASGMLAATADLARYQVFMLMNFAESYGGQPIDGDVMHNRTPEPEPVPVADRTLDWAIVRTAHGGHFVTRSPLPLDTVLEWCESYDDAWTECLSLRARASVSSSAAE